jgi:hypothetical protein
VEGAVGHKDGGKTASTVSSNQRSNDTFKMHSQHTQQAPSLPTFINTFEAGDDPLTLEGKMREVQRFIDNQLEELEEI